MHTSILGVLSSLEICELWFSIKSLYSNKMCEGSFGLLYTIISWYIKELTQDNYFSFIGSKFPEAKVTWALHLSCRGFTTLSQSLGGMLINIHSGLLKAIAQDQHDGSILQASLVLKTLIRGCPYDRLNRGIASLILKVGICYPFTDLNVSFAICQPFFPYKIKGSLMRK